ILALEDLTCRCRPLEAKHPRSPDMSQQDRRLTLVAIVAMILAMGAALFFLVDDDEMRLETSDATGVDSAADAPGARRLVAGDQGLGEGDPSPSVEAPAQTSAPSPEIKNEPSIRVRGRVVDATGGPVPGATLKASLAPRTPTSEAIEIIHLALSGEQTAASVLVESSSDADGRFELRFESSPG
ncbi:MAG: hypothetical protein KDB53_15300, partial [Planctomycetes bacterium]|nr:hypothetical protein [Planctomycetota bacterium]